MSPRRFDTLEQFQQWMQHVVIHPGGLREGLESAARAGIAQVDPDTIEEVVPASRQMSGAERLNVYSRSYILRLVEILEGDFPALRFALGPDRFDVLARDYLARHPSRHWNLNMLGEAMPEYVRDEAPDMEHREFLAELAALERAIEEVFDAKRAQPADVDELLNVPADRWGEARLRFVPAFRLFAFQYPVNDFLQEFRDKQEPRVPDAQDTWLMVYRHDFTVWRKPLAHEQFVLLRGLADGRPLGEAVEAVLDLPDTDPEPLGESLRTWFQDWAALDLFAGVTLD